MSKRLKEAELEASRLTTAEWAHIALFGADFFFAGMIVFPAAIYCDTFCTNAALVGIGPGLLIGLFCSKILTRARAVVPKHDVDAIVAVQVHNFH